MRSLYLVQRHVLDLFEALIFDTVELKLDVLDDGFGRGEKGLVDIAADACTVLN